MKTIFSDKHALQSVETEFYRGKWVEAFEIPRRAELVLAEVKRANLGPVIAPEIVKAASRSPKGASPTASTRATFCRVACSARQLASANPSAFCSRAWRSSPSWKAS